MKKKIFIICSEFPPLPGGIGNHAYHLADQLTKKNYKVSVCTDQRASKFIDDLNFDVKQSFTVHRVKRYSLSILTYLKRIWLGIKLILKTNPDIIIASGKFFLWLGAFLKLLFPKKQFICVLHGSELFAGSKASQTLTSWSLRHFDKRIAVSNFTRDLALGNNEDLVIEVINNGFSLPVFANFSNVLLKGFPKLVTVGNMTFRKGQLNVIDALPEIRVQFPEVHYHIIGLPTERNMFEIRAKELDVDNLITFHNQLPDDQMFSLVSSCDVFVMLSQHLSNGDVEGFGIAVLEANSLGLPAIGSLNSGISDAIKEGFSGKLVLPNDSRAVTTALQNIMDNYDYFSLQAKQWAVNFEWQYVIQNYIKLIER